MGGLDTEKTRCGDFNPQLQTYSRLKLWKKEPVLGGQGEGETGYRDVLHIEKKAKGRGKRGLPFESRVGPSSPSSGGGRRRSDYLGGG